MQVASIQELFGLEGKTALIIGSSSGLGRESAEALAVAGAKIGLMARRTSLLEEVADSCRSFGSQVDWIQVDATQRSELELGISALESKLGDIDILVYAAGVAPLKRAELHSEEKWNQALSTNLTGAFYASQIVGSRMIQRFEQQNDSWDGGRLIMIGSIMGSHGNPVHRNIGYAASKGGLDNMVRQLAVEWAPYQITTNAIAPSYFKTEMTTDPATGEIPAVMLDRMQQFSPSGRIGEAGEISSSILFLASRFSSYINGAIIPVDGGWSAW